jgi:16S rRNA (cytosine1402-N4)-methyltransferase
MAEPKYHESVLVDEVIEGLHINKLAKYIDATLGNGGHAAEIVNLGGKVLGIDMDPQMAEIAQKRLSKEIKEGKAKVVTGNFTDIDRIAKEHDWQPISGVLIDLGVSNIHLKDLNRGFSFENPEAPLDMRINPELQGVKAADLMNVLREDQLRELFEVTLEPGPAKWITGRVMFSRNEKPITTVGDMLEVCEGLKIGKPGLSEATLPFLALRIAVNSELANLKEVLPKAFDLLESKGRLVVISFHSKEDEIVKDFFREKSLKNEAEQITFKPVQANDEEIEKNRRSRSAKLRILEKK